MEYRTRLGNALLIAMAIMPMAAFAAENRSLPVDSSVLGMPSGPWPFVHGGPKGPETYLVPSQLNKIRRLPEPDRSISLKFIQEHEASLTFLATTMNRFFPQLRPGRFLTVPEYSKGLEEAVISIDLEDAGHDNPLSIHEPILQALPVYTRVILLAPGSAIPRIKQRLNAMGLAGRVRIVVSHPASERTLNEGVTRWVRDIMFAAQEDGEATLMISLAHKNFMDVSHNDLAYLGGMRKTGHRVLRMPIFFRGGNILVASESGRSLLLVGNEELAMNRQWFLEAFGFMPPDNAVPDILKAAAGVDRVAVLPNSRTLFHLDMIIAPLADGVVGLLAPLDPEHLVPADRNVLVRARESLEHLGFRIIPIPTTVQWMKNSQSPVNIVPFIDRRTGQPRALVPLFPEAATLDSAQSLNEKVMAAYRSAGIDPVPVKDLYHLRGGNIHCAVVPLR